MRTRLIGLFLLICFTTGVFAAGSGLDPAIIPQSAKWVIHLDVDSFLATDLGAWTRRHAEQPNIRAKLDMVAAITGFHPLEDLEAITLGGADLKKRNAVVYLQGAFDRKRLTNIAKGLDGYRSADYGDHTVHCWPDEGDPDKPIHASFVRDDLLVLSPQEDALRDVLDTFAGILPGLDQAENPMLVDDGGYFCLAIAKDFGQLAGIDERVAMLRKVSDLTFTLTEVDNILRADLRLTAASTGDADLMLQVLEGLQAFALLNDEALDPRLGELLGAITVTGDGTSLSVGLGVDLETVIQAIESSPRYRDVFGR